MFKTSPPPLYDGGRRSVPLIQEAGWAPGPGWTGAENLAPLGFDPRTFQLIASRVLQKKKKKKKMMVMIIIKVVQ